MKILPLFLFIQLSFSSYCQNIPGLTAVYEDKRELVKLKWNHSDSRITGYKIQRSADNNSWTDITQIPVSSPQQTRFITYIDEKPSAGRNFYRLKAQVNSNTIAYGSSIIVIIGKPGNNWIMYPVPVRDVLNLQYNGSNIISGVIYISIQNTATRQFFHKLRMASTNRFIQIPVSNLGRGIYLITISIDNKIVWNQQFSK